MNDRKVGVVVGVEFKKDIASIVNELNKKDKTLGKVIIDVRRLVRACSIVVTDVHRCEYRKAEKGIRYIRKELKKLKTKKYREFGKHISHIAQEYTEACALLSIVQGRPIPTSAELDVDTVAYLNGLLDCIGELRREVLEHLIKEDINTAEYLFGVMESLFSALSQVHFSPAVLPGFRGKQDMARRQIEQARSELFLAKVK